MPTSRNRDLLLPAMDPVAALKRLGDDVELLEQIIQIFLEDAPALSTCVHDTLLALESKASPTRPLKAADVFVDVAKFGRGASVAKLREHGVTEKRIDEMVGTLGMHVTRRD